MSLDENAKLSYFKSALSNIDELKAEKFYENRKALCVKDREKKHNLNHIKRNEWFMTLSQVNNLIQYPDSGVEEHDKIFTKLCAHPYFEKYRLNVLVKDLYIDRFKLKEVLKDEPAEISNLFYSLYHLHTEIRLNGIRIFESMLLEPDECSKLSPIISKLKESCPKLYTVYQDMFQFCMHVNRKNADSESEKYSQSSSKKNSEVDGKDLFFVGALILYFVFKVVHSYFKY